MNTTRAAITQTLLSLAQGRSSIFALASDSRGSASLTEFAAALPGQFVECGIAEQNTIGIAAGLALHVKRPFVFGPACFYSTRAAEQIKVDVAYSGCNVKIVGVSGGVSYGALGATHHATQDIALMRAIPGLDVCLPSDALQAEALTRYLAQSDKPAYVRVGRGAEPDVYVPGDTCLLPEKAIRLRTGKRAALLACGEMTYTALQAAELLGDVSVYDVPFIKPLDEEAVLEAAQTGLVITLEEHSIHGGLGSAVAEVLAPLCKARQCILGFPDETLHNGNSADIKAYYGLTTEEVARKVAAL